MTTEQMEEQLKREELGRRIAASLFATPGFRQDIIEAMEAESAGVGKTLEQVIEEYDITT